MNFFPLALRLKQAVPRWVYEPIRRLGNFVIAPINFGFITGHFGSAWRGKPVDSAGKPVPWLSYPAIRILQEMELKGLTVLEFGSGNSTLFFESRGAKVTSIECDGEWFAMMLRRVTTADLRHYTPEMLLDNRYPAADIVLIDGENRMACANSAVACLKERGVIILDNSDAPENHPVVELLENFGFVRVDFHGLAPGHHGPQCTSFFFDELNNLLTNLCKKPQHRHWL